MTRRRAALVALFGALVTTSIVSHVAAVAVVATLILWIVLDRRAVVNAAKSFTFIGARPRGGKSDFPLPVGWELDSTKVEPREPRRPGPSRYEQSRLINLSDGRSD